MEPRKITPVKKTDANINVPPSKSYTNRALIAAALAEGESTIRNPSRCDDSLLLIDALREFGVDISDNGESLTVTGTNGVPTPPGKDIYTGNAGTVMRFLTSFAGLARGSSTITGDERMRRRPIGDLLKALNSAGIKCSGTGGFPPVKIAGGSFTGGMIEIDGTISSQFLSSLILISPYAKRKAIIHLKGKLSSFPYIDMTLHVMRLFGALVDAPDMKIFRVDNTQRYIGRDFEIEGDASAAAYFLAAAAVTEGRVRISNLSPDSLQGDIRFISVLSEMGCKIIDQTNRVEIQGGKLHGIEVDMNGLPDCVPVLAVVAAFARGQTIIKNIATLRYKETDRIDAIVNGLNYLGIAAETSDNDLIVNPGPMHGADIGTYNDHRIAMSFAVAGLRVDGVRIKNPACVGKSFPNFWEEFKKLETGV